MLFGAWDSAFLTSSWCCSPPGSVGLVPCRCSQRVVPRSSGAASPGTWWRHKFSCHQPTESERLGLEQRNLFYSKPSWNADSASMETKLSFPPWLSAVVIVWLKALPWKWRQRPFTDLFSSTNVWTLVKGTYLYLLVAFFSAFTFLTLDTISKLLSLK